jgi:cytidine deaminase
VARISSERLARLRRVAEEARALHYAPWSGAIVLAAAELDSGAVGGGANVETANLTLTKHAEEVAILAAFAADGGPVGPGRLEAVYVAGFEPCGSCRQFAWEFASQRAIWVLEDVTQAELQVDSLLVLPPDRAPRVVTLERYLPSPFSGVRQP